MHINSHFTPAPFVDSSRPNHAADASGRAQQFQPAAADTEAAANTEATATTEETSETSIPGNTSGHSG